MSYLPILIPVLAIVAVGLLGTTRRLGFWLSLLAAVVLTPLGGFIVALLSGPRSHRASPRPTEPETA